MELVKDSSGNKNRDKKYDKIKHLVEVDDDILAVFSINSINSSDMKELHIAKNANIDKNYINSLIHVLGLNQQAIFTEKPQIYGIGQEEEKEVEDNNNNKLGKIK